MYFAGGYQTLNDNNNFVIKHKNEIVVGNKGSKLDNITYDGNIATDKTGE